MSLARQNKDVHRHVRMPGFDRFVSIFSGDHFPELSRYLSMTQAPRENQAHEIAPVTTLHH